MSSQFHLLTQRRFLPFFVTQFLGAFNDNVFKNALIVLLTFQAASWTSMAPGVTANLAAGIFILPFFLFSATAGQLADKYDRSRIARLVKVLEMGIMGIAGLGFWLHSLPLLFVALFLLGLHSTVFGPVKYAILPQQLHADELVGGNALVEAGTFVAILFGTLAGGLLAGLQSGTGWIAGAGFLIAAAGYLASWAIPRAPAPDPGLRVNWNPFTETWRNIGFAAENRTVFLSIMGISWFWLYGAIFLAQFPSYAKDVLGGGENSVTLLLATFTVGIGVGSLLCERLSAREVEIGLVPFGAIGLSLFGFDLAFASPASPAGSDLAVAALLGQPAVWRVLFDLAMIGLFGGFFIVPLYALVQQRSAEAHRARIIAANNIVNAAFMVVGALAAAGLLDRGMSIPWLFAVAALCNAVVALFIFKLVPEFLIRFVVWLLVHTVYRLEKHGLENVPAEGPALIVCNHVSFVDALVIASACRRPIRFLMDHRIFRWPILSFVFRHGRAIPIAPAKEDPALMQKALHEASAALEAGELVCIFPEGRLTSDGEVGVFRPGMCSILEGAQCDDVPVVPMALRGLWGSYFSRKGGSAMSKPFRRGLFNRIALEVGPGVSKTEADPNRLRDTVVAMRGDWR